MKEKWSIEQANEWYQKQGWLRGCNFIGSDWVNRLDGFQNYKHEEKLKTAEREIALAKEIGFNTVRIWANFDVYYAEPESYMEILDKYIDLFAKYGQKVMMVLAYEEDLPRGDVFIPKPMGEQKYMLGSFFGRFPLTEEEKELTAKHYMEYPEIRGKFIEMVTRIVRKYANDERIICWNIINEPGIRIGERSIEIMKTLFEIVRNEDPIQPLCADIWNGIKDGKLYSKTEEVALELSDVVSFHSYQPYDRLVAEIRHHQKTGRPVILTEWLHRINHNEVHSVYPLCYLTNVGNYCWGFVNGFMQAHLPWEFLWDQWESGKRRDYDFTKWQHDLFRVNMKPYDPREIEIIKRFNKLAIDEGR